MKYRTLRFFIPSLALAFMMCACQVEEPQSPDLNEGDENIIPVAVSLKLNVGGEAYGTPQTKSIDDPGTVQNTQIKNMVVLQYNGTGDDATLVGDVHYLDSTLPETDEHYLDMTKIKLACSMGELHTLIFLTNTFTEIRAEETLGAMLRLWREAGGEPDVFGHEGDGAELDPDNRDYFQRMNAIAVTEVDEGTEVYATLRRSMARINVEIQNSGADGLQITKVWLGDVSQKDYYITDYSYIDPDDHTNVQLLRNDEFQTEYVPGLPMRTNYVDRGWTGDNTAGTGTGTATYRWYVPSNMRGTDATNTLPSEKNRCPNAVGATYLYIEGVYGEEHDQGIVYKFYLGENLTDNFDLKPNTSYTYRITFDGKGNVETDKRIEDFGRIDFMVDANSYILNPPKAGMPDRKYTINVVHRPNTFWGVSDSNDRYGNFTDYPVNYIHGTETWKARILWSDFNYDQNAVLTTNNGTGAGNYRSMNQRIELTVPSDINHGNMVIGVWTDDPTNILWSWHIWITDYKPDGIAGHAPSSGAYVYKVEGGEVHRYNNAMFNTGDLENGYIMDRNLGALDQKYHGNTRGGGFYYQHGRKDPFPAGYTISLYGYGQNEPSNSLVWANNGNLDMGPIAAGNTGRGGKNVPYSVNHPMRFITANGGWAYNDEDNYPTRTNVFWLDKYASDANGAPENGEPGKSFFDPCPPGWKVPANGWDGGFVFGNTSTSSSTANFIWDADYYNGHNRVADGHGATYYPNGYLADKMSNETVFFPAGGRRDRTGNFSLTAGYGAHGTLWSSLPVSNSIGRIIYYCYNFVDANNSTSAANQDRTFGANVRCVRE